MIKRQNIENFISSLSDLELKYFFTYRYESLINNHKLIVDSEFKKRNLDKLNFILNEKLISSEKKRCIRCGSSQATWFKKDLNYHDPDSLPTSTIYKMIFKGYKHESYFECKICSFVYE